MTQHVWLTIVKSHHGWAIAKAEGHTVFPSKGVALAIRHVYQSLLKCLGEEPGPVQEYL
jgi:hypothetical protein